MKFSEERFINWVVAVLCLCGVAAIVGAILLAIDIHKAYP